MPADSPDLATLLHALHALPADLDANRSGQLSPGQRAHLMQLQRRALMLGTAGFFSFALLATLALFIAQQDESLVLSVVGSVLILCNAFFVGMVARHWLRLQADLRAEEIEALRGPLERVIKQGRSMNNFVLRIAGVEFVVTKDLFKLFRHEKPYAFYRTRHSRLLLSAEPLDSA